MPYQIMVRPLMYSETVDTLKVQLAAEGIPDSGSIDYSFFSDKAGIGMTENEFNVMKIRRDANGISKFNKKIDGIKDAKCHDYDSRTKDFRSDETNNEASASIVLTTRTWTINLLKVKSMHLYTLVSKCVPNLPTDNIVIMNQNFNYYDLKDGESYTIGTELDSKQH